MIKGLTPRDAVLALVLLLAGAGFGSVNRLGIATRLGRGAGATNVTPPPTDPAARPIDWGAGDNGLDAAAVLASPLIKELLTRLEKPDTTTESRFSEADFRQLLRDPRATRMNWGLLVEEATPPPKGLVPKKKPVSAAVFLKDAKVAQGVEFWRDNSAVLERAFDKHHVAPKDIVSVLMWQSNLGKVTGDLPQVSLFLGRVLFLAPTYEHAVRSGHPDTADYAHRGRLNKQMDDAVGSLATLLRFSKANSIDPLEIKGLGIGAAGIAQFLPAGLHWLQDGDPNGRIELGSTPDAIMGIANCLAASGYSKSRIAGLLGYNPGAEWAKGVIQVADRIEAKLTSPAITNAPIEKAPPEEPEFVTPDFAPPPRKPLVKEEEAPRVPLRPQAPEPAEGNRAPLRPQPEAEVGSLRVLTFQGGEPLWASLSIDGKPSAMKVTPATLELPVGRHTVAVERAGYRPIERVIEIEAGKRVVLKLELLP